MGRELDARTLREAMTRFLEALRIHRDEIDSLNVFPVPDGDTGTNLLATQQAVVDALETLPGGDMGEVGDAVSRAALMGARGNSGVIMSQVLRGLCGRLARSTGSGEDLADALARASDEAHRAVAEPQDGTMLSVLADAAGAARRAPDADNAPDGVADRALEAARESLARTRETLPELARAGVVDAGGKGVVLLLDALVSVLRGVSLSEEIGEAGPVGRGDGQETEAASAYGFEVMYLTRAPDDRVDELRRRLSAIGDSVVVVGAEGLYTAHVHTDDPDAAVAEGREAGGAEDVRVASLDEQVARACLGNEARAVRAEGVATLEAQEATVPATTVVAVAPGEGVARLFRDLGAAVVPGGPGDLPSVGDLLGAIDGVPSQSVLVLPNHPNVLPAAERAVEESRKRGTIVPTRSVPAGLSAAAAASPDQDLDGNAREAAAAAEGVTAAEVATAVRDADTPAGLVRAGQSLGLVEGDVRVVGDDPVAVAIEVVRPLVGDQREVLTVLAGEAITEDVMERAGRDLRAAFDGLEVEIHRGGQPGYPFLLGVE